MKHFSQNTVVGLVAAVQFLPGALSLEATVQVTLKPAPLAPACTSARIWLDS